MTPSIPAPGRFEADNVINLNRGAFVRELLGPRAIPTPPTERYELRTWADGYRIFDRGELIASFHGPQLDLAWRLLKALRADAEITSAPSAA